MFLSNLVEFYRQLLEDLKTDKHTLVAVEKMMKTEYERLQEN